MATSNNVDAELELAFASPIMRFTFPNAAEMNALIEAEAYAIHAETEGVTRSNRNGWHSETDLMKRTEPGLSQLASLLPKAVNAITKQVAPEYDATAKSMWMEGWININPQHGYNGPHSHGSSMWSGCYYVKQPYQESDNAGAIQFLSPLLLPDNMRDLGGKTFRSGITLRPQPGDLLLFPSYLTHWVIPNESEEDRISIAFNAKFIDPPK